MRTFLARLTVLAAAWLGAAAIALAQPFPAKTVRMTAPYSSGSGPTVFMRVLADKLSTLWGRQAIVEARPGASGFIAVEAVKNAAPDGYELLVVSNAHVTINPALYKKLPYDPEKDFVPVATLFNTPFFITVSTSGPYQSVPALIAAAKAQPDGLTFGTPYVGSPGHLGGALFASLTGTKMTFVHFKDQSQLFVSLAANDLAWTLASVGTSMSFTKAGRIKFLALAAKQRLKSLPEVPTVEEAGGPAGYEVDSWLALLAPRGTPPELVRRINGDVNKVLADPDMLERMQVLGFEAFPSTPEQLAELIRTDTKKYGDLVRRTGATAD
jgi:tripartite-type tricarboxylate transporter receptor subunit TctC